MTAKILTLASILTLFLTTTAAAIDKSEVKEKWHTPFDLYLNAREAYEIKTAHPDDVLFIDVRNRPEIHYIGMADQIDANIPYYFDSTEWKMKKDGVHGTFRKIRNDDFEEAVENALKSKGLTKESPIIIMCTSGSRAPRAARTLHEAGFKKVYTQVEGFEGIKAKEGEHKGKRLVAGWKHEGLPWSYDLPAAKMYFNFDPKALAKKALEESAEETSQ
ncbi:MAG: rhodanese-like domain-containing protein [Gammaproteobacteria bacterium]